MSPSFLKIIFQILCPVSLVCGRNIQTSNNLGAFGSIGGFNGLSSVSGGLNGQSSNGNIGLSGISGGTVGLNGSLNLSTSQLTTMVKESLAAIASQMQQREQQASTELAAIGSILFSALANVESAIQNGTGQLSNMTGSLSAQLSGRLNGSTVGVSGTSGLLAFLNGTNSSLGIGGAYNSGIGLSSSIFGNVTGGLFASFSGIGSNSNPLRQSG